MRKVKNILILRQNSIKQIKKGKYWNKLSNFMVALKWFKKLDTNHIDGDVIFIIK